MADKGGASRPPARRKPAHIDSWYRGLLVDDAHPSCPELLIEFPHLVAGVNFSRCGLFAARDRRVVGSESGRVDVSRFVSIGGHAYCERRWALVPYLTEALQNNDEQ